MQKRVLNYRIIVEPEKYDDGSTVFVAYCPTLGISDYGDTIEEVLASLKDGIELAVASLVKQDQEVPTDDIQDQLITSTTVNFPLSSGLRLAA